MAEFEDEVKFHGDLVRKALQGTVCLGKWPDADVIDSLEDTDDGGIKLPEEMEAVGWISDDGITFSRDKEVSDVTPWGSSTAIRRDIQSTEKTMQFAALETKKLTKELVLEMDLGDKKMSETGEVVITEPAKPSTHYWRALAIGTDGDGDKRYYFARYYAKANVSEMDDEVWSDGDDPLAYNVTLEANMDDDAGFAVREFLFGPGALDAAKAMGWKVEGESGD